MASSSIPPTSQEPIKTKQQGQVEEQRIPISLGRESGGILVLLIFIAVLMLATSSFLTWTNLDNLVRQVAVFAILSIGQLFVILTGGIDLSVGSVLGLSGGVTALLLIAKVPIPLAILAGLAIGVFTGLLNGMLVAYLKLPPFIATLGMLGVARGLVLLLTGAKTIAPLADSFNAIANGFFLGLPSLFWILLLVAVVAAFVLERTVFGRYVYAVGSNAESARLSGVPVNIVLIAVYCISGLLAGLAGVLTTSRLGAGIPTAGTGYELQAIAGAVIGGASLSGAKGRVSGAVIGALIMAMLANGGNLLAIDPFYLQIAIGLLIILAVYFDHLQGRTISFVRRPS
ncbi:sugar ABC transporter permease [Reticulibacter mediterranei]|uniref:Sugar ABC transporter permease n=1 Tax=Reticulibacter mediterranei TaxID=2778369 RepID=A0A8J3MX91_9CHLR|nr:ABC transporter permease [Reticulibacter mediterranei]GHO90699.1 sugar ABC transporter permease [Reticulibacter mediterranei]